jgi:signal transduction histidine kinase
MGISESMLSCRLDGLTPAARIQQRLSVLTDFGLLQTESVPVFEEATQTAVHVLDAPICWLSIFDHDRQWLKSAVGLSRLGLMNDLALSRQISLAESFCVHVVDSQQPLVIADTYTHPAFANSILTYQYGIRAYLGIPLLTASGECLGTLAVMDIVPRAFSDRDVDLLVLLARLSMSEYERLYRAKAEPSDRAPLAAENAPPNPLKIDLLTQLTQELRTPLTSVMGMASMLNREVYGPLTGKQKEYMDIIHTSGEYLLSLVQEMLELSQWDDRNQTLNLVSVDIEMLCQQAISTVSQVAHRREQQIRLTVEPGNRIWLLDKERIRQMLYHLMFDIIQSSNTGSILRLHISNKSTGLKLTLWTTHPCLEEDLGYDDLDNLPLINTGAFNSIRYDDDEDELADDESQFAYRTAVLTPPTGLPTDLRTTRFGKDLGLLLSRHLVELHGGQILIQGELEPSRRYTITLPRLIQPQAQ